MARYVCELADHEAQSHGWQDIAEGAGVPAGRYPACCQVVAGALCRSFLRECGWCAEVAVARAENETGRLWACAYHAIYLVDIGDSFPRCEECNDAVLDPSAWRCDPCEEAIAKTEPAWL